MTKTKPKPRKRKSRAKPAWHAPPEFPADKTFDAALSRIKSERQRVFVRALTIGRKSGTMAAIDAGCHKCSAYACAGKWKRLPLIAHALSIWARTEELRRAHRQHVLKVVYADGLFPDDAGKGDLHVSTRPPQIAPDGAEIIIQYANPDREQLEALARENPDMIGKAALEALESIISRNSRPDGFVDVDVHAPASPFGFGE
jgi:hypothetical protein